MAKQPPVNAKSLLVLFLDIIVSIFVFSFLVGIVTQRVFISRSGFSVSATSNDLYIIGTLVFMYAFVSVQWCGGTVFMHLVHINPRNKKKSVRKK